ncbi:MAG: class I SAM-dependent methyltransferase [Sinobacteraceae bacterium]|nr:class I SAM-dependent methyltransferase [Nevskiaceae bacterium]MCP5473086.1 class I SAM-dependent methyltransferase [Nevskiaceae bacterium]
MNSSANSRSAKPPEAADGSATRNSVAPDEALRSIDGRVLDRLARFAGAAPLEFVMGDRVRALTPGARATGRTIATVRLRDRATLLSVIADPAIGFGDAYADGRIEIDGDLIAFLDAMYRAVPDGGAGRGFSPRSVRWLERSRRNTLKGSRDNIWHHYDIGNAFYALWLGSTMAYTCAYYPEPTTTLDAAQIAKFDHVCRKLWLRPDQQVIEAGCGWGGLALHMARHYGVKVRAFNISREQLAFARERARAEGLDGRVEFVEDDYRNIAGRCDAFVSIGMLEHVGVEHYDALGSVIARCLDPQGRGLIHTIGRNRPAKLHPWIEKRIFPGAQPPSLSEMMQIFEPHDFSVLDVENLRLHYARTLTDWKALYDANEERIRAMFDERFVRMWRLYLAGSITGFTTGSLQLFQVLFAPRYNNDLPPTRAHLYHD